MAIALGARAVGAPTLARTRNPPPLAGLGLLDLAANVLLALAAREGLVSLVAVLVSLHPVATVLLARTLLAERITRVQHVGVGFALAGVCLIAGGSTMSSNRKEQAVPVRISDLMTRGLVTCPADTSLGQAAAILVRERIHAVVVTDQDGRPTGVLSDSDLLGGEWQSTDAKSLETMKTMTAGEFQSTPPETIDADASIAEAAQRLHKAHLSRLLVLEHGELVGVLSVSDLVRNLGRAPTSRRTVADVMSRAFAACLPDTPARALARAMTERRTRSIVVLERGGRPLGVVTGHDLLPLVDDEGAATAGSLMHPPFVIAPGASLAEAADAMLRHEVHRLLVVEDGDGLPLGVISTWDILVEMAEPGSVWQA